MTALQQNRYDQLLRRVSDLKGPGSKVNDVLTELFPMFDVENVPPELLVLSGSRLCMGTDITGSGGVAEFNHTSLQNPVGSGVIARLISIVAFTGASLVHYGPTQNVIATSGNMAFADGRVFGEGTTCFIGGSNNNLVIGSDFYQLQPDLSNFDVVWDQNPIAVISPGTAFMISNGVAQNFLRTSWVWIERQAQPSELNL